MRFENRSWIVVVLSGLCLAPLSALADDPSPQPSPAPAPSSAPSAAPSSAPSSAPVAQASPAPGARASWIPPNVALSTAGLLGGTEAGVGIGGTVRAENTETGAYIELTAISGQPYLRLRGSTELFPVRIVKKRIQLPNGEFGFDLDVVPVRADAQWTVPGAGDPWGSHLVINPVLAASLDLGLGATHTRVRLRTGPTGGVVGDRDGVTGMIGVQSGADLTFELDLGRWQGLNGALGEGNTALEFRASGDLINAAGIPTGYMVGGGVRLTHTRETTGQQVFVGLQGQTTRLDVERGGNVDCGQTGFFGLTGGVVF